MEPLVILGLLAGAGLIVFLGLKFIVFITGFGIGFAISFAVLNSLGPIGIIISIIVGIVVGAYGQGNAGNFFA